MSPLAASTLLLLLVACSPVASDPPADGAVKTAHLSSSARDAEAFGKLRAALIARNPGYDIEYSDDLRELATAARPRVAFVQRANDVAAVVERASGERADSVLAAGDVILLRPGERLELGSPIAALVFHVPTPLPPELPPYIRPDYDPRITDTPGGCAEDGGAYRRILLTWLAEKGPYVYRGLNAHRVRIFDSFTHYHPLEGGFDELYLVQGVEPGARLVTSEAVALIERGQGIDRAQVAELFDVRQLAPGDLVYMPRGTAHRGLGGVLAQVIALPGFVPGAEIGIDHRVRALNERLGLAGGEALPFHAAAADAPVVK